MSENQIHPDVLEIVVYDSHLSKSEMYTVEHYLREKHGMKPLSLWIRIRYVYFRKQWKDIKGRRTG